MTILFKIPSFRLSDFASSSVYQVSLVIDPAGKKVDLVAFGLGEFGQLGIYLADGKRANERKFAYPVNGLQGIDFKSVRLFFASLSIV